ncbi:unnamed protein product, partial [Meganyctiphanes norvegica]
METLDKIVEPGRSPEVDLVWYLRIESVFHVGSHNEQREQSQQEINEAGFEDLSSSSFLDLSSSSNSSRRPRTFLHPWMVQFLKKEYEKCNIPTRAVKQKLCLITGLNFRVVETWFQNRRAKEKRNARRIFHEQFTQEGDSEKPDRVLYNKAGYYVIRRAKENHMASGLEHEHSDKEEDSEEAENDDTDFDESKEYLDESKEYLDESNEYLDESKEYLVESKEYLDESKEDLDESKEDESSEWDRSVTSSPEKDYSEIPKTLIIHPDGKIQGETLVGYKRSHSPNPKSQESESQLKVIPKKAGRPRKYPRVEPADNMFKPEVIPRKRGRPFKVKRGRPKKYSIDIVGNRKEPVQRGDELHTSRNTVEMEEVKKTSSNSEDIRSNTDEDLDTLRNSDKLEEGKEKSNSKDIYSKQDENFDKVGNSNGLEEGNETSNSMDICSNISNLPKTRCKKINLPAGVSFSDDEEFNDDSDEDPDFIPYDPPDSPEMMDDLTLTNSKSPDLVDKLPTNRKYARPAVVQASKARPIPAQK